MNSNIYVFVKEQEIYMSEYQVMSVLGMGQVPGVCRVFSSFQADFRLVDKIGLLVPLEAVQACCYIEKKSQKPPKDLKSEMVDSG